MTKRELMRGRGGEEGKIRKRGKHGKIRRASGHEASE